MRRKFIRYGVIYEKAARKGGEKHEKCYTVYGFAYYLLRGNQTRVDVKVFYFAAIDHARLGASDYRLYSVYLGYKPFGALRVEFGKYVVEK
jgi:hypothetical protein